MAKVLLTTYTNMPGGVLDSFRQGFVDALVASGNEVLLLKSNDLIANYEATNQLAPNVNAAAVTSIISKFAPDLIISLNNSGLYSELLKAINCPIAVWLLDGPAYLVDPDEFRRQCDRYHVLTPVRAFSNDLQFDFGFDQKRIHYLPFCSDFRNRPATTIHNISFVGTYFHVGKLSKKLEALVNQRSDWMRLSELLKSYKDDPNMLWSDRLQKYRLEKVFTGHFDEAWILNTFAINNRVRTLDAIQDLGLTLCGTPTWLDVAQYSVQLAMSYTPQQVLTRADLEGIYNSSKIAFNISHVQARGGLPWRIFDVMACGAALVSNPEDDLQQLFGKDVQIPTYNSAAEARAVCQSLLEDNARRLDIIQRSNAVIEKSHRFKHRIASIGQALKLNLLSGGKGKLTQIDMVQVLAAMEVGALNRPRDHANKSNFSKIDFPIEVFYSPTLEFAEDRKVSVTKPITPGEQLAVNIEMKNAAPFLRLDLGVYFSTHEQPKISILKPSSEGEEKYELDLERDILARHQFAMENGRLICGFDSHCIFRNPFEGADISLRFQSKVTSGI